MMLWLSLHIGAVIGIGFLLAIGLTVGIAAIIVGADEQNAVPIVIGIIVCVLTIAISIGIWAYHNWSLNNTASGARYVKDVVSEVEKGIDREITIRSWDGKEIYHYEGKIDLEGVEDDSYILFEDADGYRQIIYPGDLDTVIIVEKEADS